MSAADVRDGISKGVVRRGAHVRDEGGQWTPIEQSPFGSLFGQIVPPSPKAGSSFGAFMLLVLVLLPVGLLLYGAQSCSDHAKKEEARREADRRQREVDSAKANQARSEAEISRVWPRYQTLMDAIATEPPVTLGEMYELMGDPDQCKPTADGDFDVCFWFLTSDSRLKIFAYSMGPGDIPNSSPRAWVREVVFAKDGKMDRRIGGAIKQMMDQGQQ